MAPDDALALVAVGFVGVGGGRLVAVEHVDRRASWASVVPPTFATADALAGPPVLAAGGSDGSVHVLWADGRLTVHAVRATVGGAGDTRPWTERAAMQSGVGVPAVAPRVARQRGAGGCARGRRRVA